MLVRQIQASDADRVAEILNFYIANTTITFRKDAMLPEEVCRSIEKTKEKYDWLALELEGNLVGFAYYGSFREKEAYRFTVESTIYLHPEYGGKGYGKILYNALIDNARQKGFKEMIGGIALPNVASIKLHTALGFEKVAHFKNIGFKFDRWIDVGFWQRSLSSP